jgi:predicted lipoprotein
MSVKRIRSFVVLVAAVFAAFWFSFYTEPLQEHRDNELQKQFSPNQLVDYHWKKDMDALLKTALTVSDFNAGMCRDATGFSAKNAKVPGLGAKSYFLITGEVVLTEVCDKALSFQFGTKTTGAIQIKYLFSNTARDASGWFKAGDFQNTMDFNTVSTYLNSKILAEVVGKNALTYKAGDRLTFWGAVEVSPEDYPVKELEIVPLRLQSVNK